MINVPGLILLEKKHGSTVISVTLYIYMVSTFACYVVIVYARSGYLMERNVSLGYKSSLLFNC
jgi:hypothetical protein